VITYKISYYTRRKYGYKILFVQKINSILKNRKTFGEFHHLYSELRELRELQN